jgi:hypothetical protein
MAVTVTQYGLFLQSLIEGRVVPAVDEMWVMLVTSSYTFNQHTHKFKSVVTGELTGSGYTAGGQKVTTSASVYDSPTKTLKIPAGNVAWPSVTFSGAVGAILYMKPSGFPENAMPLIAYISFGESISRSASAFYLNWPATGVLKLAVP